MINHCKASRTGNLWNILSVGAAFFLQTPETFGASDTVESKLGSLSGALRDKIAECCQVAQGNTVGFNCPKTPKAISCLQALASTQSKSVERSWKALVQSFEGKSAAAPALKCVEQADGKMSSAIHSDFTSVKLAVECLEKVIPTLKVREAFNTFKNQYLGFEAVADRCLIAKDQIEYTPLDQGRGRFISKVNKLDKKCRPDLVFSGDKLKSGNEDKAAVRSKHDDGRAGEQTDSESQKSARLLPEDKAKSTEKGSESNKDGLPWAGVTYEKCDALFPKTQVADVCVDCNVQQSASSSQKNLKEIGHKLTSNPFEYEQKVLKGEDKKHGKMTSVSYLELLRLEGFERTMKAACWTLGRKPALPKSCGHFSKGYQAFDCAHVAEVQPWAPLSDRDLAEKLAHSLGLYEKAEEQYQTLLARLHELYQERVMTDAPAGGAVTGETAEMTEVKNQLEELKKYMGSVVTKNPLLLAGVPENAKDIWSAKNLPVIQELRKKRGAPFSLKSIQSQISRLKKFTENDSKQAMAGFCSRDPEQGGVDDSDILARTALAKGLEERNPELADVFKKVSTCLNGIEKSSLTPKTAKFIGMSLFCVGTMVGSGVTLGATAPLTAAAGAACSTYWLDDAFRDKDFAENKAKWVQACTSSSQGEICDYEDYLRAREEYESAASAVKFGIITLPLDFAGLGLAKGMTKAAAKHLSVSKIREVTRRLYGLGVLPRDQQGAELRAIARVLGRDPSEFKLTRIETVKRYVEEVEKAGDGLHAAKASKDADRIAKAQKHLDSVLADEKAYKITQTEMIDAQAARVAENRSLLNRKYDDLPEGDVKAAMQLRDQQSKVKLDAVAKKAEADGVKVKTADDIPLVSERELARTKKDFPDLHKLFPDEHETTVSRAIQALERDGFSAKDVKRILKQNKKNCGMFPGQLDYCASIAGSIEKRLTHPEYLQGSKAKTPDELAKYIEDRFLLICKNDCPGECKPRSKIPGVGIVLPEDDQLVCESSWRAHEQEKLKRAKKYGFLEL